MHQGMSEKPMTPDSQLAGPAEPEDIAAPRASGAVTRDTSTWGDKVRGVFRGCAGGVSLHLDARLQGNIPVLPCAAQRLKKRGQEERSV